MLAIHWLALGVGLGALEMVLPGIFLLWLGLAAIATGLVLLAMPLPLVPQLVLFAAMAGLSIVLACWVRKKLNNKPSDQPNLNNTSKALVGKTVWLETPLHQGRGRAKLEGSSWAVRLQNDAVKDLPAGAALIVLAVDGATLVVEEA